ncbi:hypothetical protein MICROWOLF_51 [Mycobacterium phage Microwolf]|uniref:Uncharacterized protein n=10 Tax=Microwolfvirus TaxID=2942894 RepID=A0A345L1G0_9CAUD|nr:hypothetical protein FGG61_gp44 [Mycobacterium phage Microwolf]ALA11680.1 hypothetical protein SEA_DAHUDSON_51 [Mycobacterium phage DaHudson]AMS01664.1 hypothetical protein PBI_MALINSILVA_53 [Mycobacterium phage Malinsilva]ANU79295.1 hypothetical protein SEA_AGLET_52 [Mycobacterium phage Aglet]AOY12148.1 hypothetical protein SEA_WATSON_51 [Mycobacterium phage Watson]AVP42001.1 hypothetical protein SEA_LILITH_52 [Mycobacterium phage Lilith]AWD93408.1 hypothetical protein SEA_PGHHAMLIN_53 [M
MKEITIVLRDGPMVHVHGELALDASESSLLVYGDSGAHMNFNWDNVLYYAVAPSVEESTSGV